MSIYRVYVAGPYSCGIVSRNVQAAVEAGDVLLRRGYAPYIPHLNHLWDLLSPHDYETWLRLDMAYLACCEGLLRLTGESPGADREVAFALDRGIKVAWSVDDFPALTTEGKV